MGGHDHGHGEPYKVPDSSIYRVEDIPELVEVQEALKRQGLKDPWLRNEVWRFDPKYFGTKSQRVRLTFTRGMLTGAILAAATIGIEKLLELNNDNDGEHH